MKRFKTYGDIVQNARDKDELEELLRRCHNHVPAVILFLEVSQNVNCVGGSHPVKYLLLKHNNFKMIISLM